MLDRKTILVCLLKSVIYACGVFLAALGVSALTSCTVTHSIEGSGHSRIIYVDTTDVNHSGSIVYPKH